MNERIRELTEQVGMKKGQELRIVASGVGVGRSITMSERIRELIKQHDVDITIDGMGYGEGNIEDLIKLIARECAKIAFQNDTAKFTRDGYRIGLDIQKHFGVEE